MRRIAGTASLSVCLFAAVVLTVGISGCGKDEPAATKGGRVVMLCAAGIRPPMEVIRAKFEKINGCTLDIS